MNRTVCCLGAVYAHSAILHSNNAAILGKGESKNYVVSVWNDKKTAALSKVRTVKFKNDIIKLQICKMDPKGNNSVDLTCINLKHEYQ